MGSFTKNTAAKLLGAIFPNNGSGAAGWTGSGTSNQLTSAALSTTPASLRIYNTTADNANNVGIYSSAANASMQQAIHLIRGVGASASTAYTILDTNITPSGFSGNPNVGGSAATGVTLAIPTQADYGGYLPIRMAVGGSTTDSGTGGTPGGTSNAWKGWTLDTSGSLPAVKNDGAITFPTSTAAATVPVIIGFLVTADLAWTTGTFSAATASGSSVIAYGDLSSSRSIQNTDTPVFTHQSISITLD